MICSSDVRIALLSLVSRKCLLVGMQPADVRGAVKTTKKALKKGARAGAPVTLSAKATGVGTVTTLLSSDLEAVFQAGLLMHYMW